MRADQIAISPVRLWFFACFHGISQPFQENLPFIFQASVVLKPLVSLIGRLIACSARISVDTNGQTTVTLAAHAWVNHNH